MAPSLNFKWIETTPEGRRERPLKDEKEYEHLLACAFGIRLPPGIPGEKLQDPSQPAFQQRPPQSPPSRVRTPAN
ncbi:hypothetical protein [Synechococcus sp. H55.7]|uniref:hypothetical protein n=1 Tax=unclassified Synechococcus TaxID=2626047 RepID=UPI0039C3CA63